MACQGQLSQTISLLQINPYSDSVSSNANPAPPSGWKHNKRMADTAAGLPAPAARNRPIENHFNHESRNAGWINTDRKAGGIFPQKPTKKTKSRKSSADFRDYADNSRERRHLAGVLEIGTINPPAGCRRSQQQPRQYRWCAGRCPLQNQAPAKNHSAAAINFRNDDQPIES